MSIFFLAKPLRGRGINGDALIEQETARANSKLRVSDAQRNHDLLLVEFYRTTGTLWF